MAQEDLRQAYSSAVNYFTDHPTGILTSADLQNYGFKPSPNVTVMIINGRLSDLLLISSYNVPGSQIYIASPQGMSQPGASGQSSGEPNQGSGGGSGASTGQQNTNPAGNPSQQQNLATNQDVVELCNQATLMDLMDAYGTAQGYLGRNPGQEVTKDILLASKADILDHEFNQNPGNEKFYSKEELESTNKFLAYGCVSTTKLAVESVQEISATLENALRRYGDRILAKPDCAFGGMLGVPHAYDIALSKLRNMVAAAKQVHQEHSN